MNGIERPSFQPPTQPLDRLAADERMTGAAAATLRQEEMWRLASLLLSRWKTVLPVVLIATGLVGFLLRYLPPTYSATAEVLIDSGKLEYADLADDTETPRTSILPTEVETYMKMLSSDRLARDVVQTIGPGAFIPREPAWAPLRRWYQRTIVPVMQPLVDKLLVLLPPIDRRLDLPALSAVPGEQDLGSAPSPVDLAVDVFQSQVEFGRDPLAALISISYRASNPLLAARVANATAAAFLDELVRVQKESLVASADYLRERVAALAAELEADDANAVALRRKLSDFGDGSLTQRRYGELLRTLSEAEADLVEKRNDAALAVGRVGLQGDAVDPILTELRQKDAVLSAKLAEMASDLQERHPQVITARAEQAEIRARIRAETDRLRRQTSSDLEVGQAQVDWLHAELARIERQMASDMNDQLALKQLSTRTESTRLLYQDILTRYQRSREQQLMVRAPARVIRAAREPSRPEGGRQWMIIAATAIGSFAAVAGLAIVLEMRRKAYRSTDELRRDVALPVLGALPLLDWNARRDLSSGGKQTAQRRVFAEAIRRVALRLQPSRRDGAREPTIILVTSAVPEEGKTIVSLSLGRQLTQFGLKVLVIDGNLRNRTPKDQYGHLPLPDEDLVSLVAATPSNRRKGLSQALISDARLGLDFLIARKRSDDPIGMISSAGMSELMDDLRERYDVILIDAPPTLAVADTMAFLPLADRVLFVVRWDATARNMVGAALDEIELHGWRPCDLVLNAVDLRTYPRHAANDHLAHLGLRAGYAR